MKSKFRNRSHKTQILLLYFVIKLVFCILCSTVSWSEPFRGSVMSSLFNVLINFELLIEKLIFRSWFCNIFPSPSRKKKPKCVGLGHFQKDRCVLKFIHFWYKVSESHCVLSECLGFYKYEKSFHRKDWWKSQKETFKISWKHTVPPRVKVWSHVDWQENRLVDFAFIAIKYISLLIAKPKMIEFFNKCLS